MTSILLDDTSAIARIELNRPDVGNAFDPDLIAAFQGILERIIKNEAVRVVVLSGKGKHFSAGADLHWMKSMATFSKIENEADAKQLAILLHTLYTLPKPTIAAIQGSVYGGGVGLVACCDIAIATDDAAFCFSETKLGLIPAVISPYVIAAIGQRQATRYFLSSERFDAPKAEQMGLIHEVCAAEKFMTRVDAIAQQLLQCGPAAQARAKALIQHVAAEPLSAALIEYTSEQIATIRVSAEGQEGVQAFLEKRVPGWALPS